VLVLQIGLDDLRPRCLPLVVAFSGLANVQARMAPSAVMFESARRTFLNRASKFYFLTFVAVNILWNSMWKTLIWCFVTNEVTY
jgi:hypothetical protein